jgi:tetratricopeptide (TPR) repeat protein
LPVLYSALNWITTLSESYIGIGIFVLILIGVITGLRLKGVKSRTFRANAGDLAAIVYVCIQVATYVTSRSRPNTVHYLGPYVIALCLYFATRLLSRWPVTTAKLSCRVLVGFGALLIVTTLPLEIESIQAATKTFSSSALPSIRAALPLAGMSTKNDMIAVLLSILPFALAGSASKRRPNRYFWIVSTVVAAGLSAILILSFSRSGYLALGLLLISFVILTVSSKAVSAVRISVVLACLCTVAGAAVIYVRAENAIVAMVRGEDTVSQKRSTDGRLAIWRESASEVVKHPIFGIGGGTDGIVALKRLAHSDLPFAARSYNGPLEILTISGVGGLASYGIFLLYPLWITGRASRQRHILWPCTALLAAGLLALMAHDLTYASMVTHGLTIIIAWVTVALLQNVNSRTEMTNTRARRRILNSHLAYLTLGVSCVSFVLSLYLARAEKHYMTGSAALMAGDDRKARAEFERAIQMEPKQPMFYAADGLTAEEEALGTSLAPNLWRNLPASTNEKELLLAIAESDYKKSISLAENDGSFWSDLAWVETFRGENEQAEKSFAHAIQADPNDVMSRIGAGLLLERRKSETEAIEQYAYAIAVSPRILDSQFFADLRTRNADMAKAIVERSCDLFKTFPASPIHLAAMAKLHAFLGAEELAHSEYEKALNLLPNLSYTWANLGMLDLQRGNRSLAHTEFERALFLDGTNRLATNMLASIDREDGNLDSAQHLYARTLLLPESSIHTQRSWRLYHVLAPVPDDLVPPGLLSYLSPDIRSLEICDESWLERLREAGVEMPDMSRRISSQEKFCSTDRSTSVQNP